MENILRSLRLSQVVVDLGCGLGSFNYSRYTCRVIGIDVMMQPASLNRAEARFQYVRALSSEIPLASGSVDAVICNHAMEHFPDYRQSLKEIDRILNRNGMLWISVPNGSGFDDALYRLLFKGGGHVNRFTQEGLVEEVRRHARLELTQSIDLYSGFVYLKTPAADQYPFFPPLARLLFWMPKTITGACVLSLNAATRLLDKGTGFRTSLYGWGFVFTRPGVMLPSLPSYFNVCWSCGSGNGAAELQAKGRISKIAAISTYTCLNCGARGIFFTPLPHLS